MKIPKDYYSLYRVHFICVEKAIPETNKPHSLVLQGLNNNPKKHYNRGKS